MNALRDACERGVVIVAITQCAKGSVSNAYETGRTLLQAGVVPGGDMTPEVGTPPAFDSQRVWFHPFLTVRPDQTLLPPLQTRALHRAGAQPDRRAPAWRAHGSSTRRARQHDRNRCEPRDDRRDASACRPVDFTLSRGPPPFDTGAGADRQTRCPRRRGGGSGCRGAVGVDGSRSGHYGGRVALMVNPSRGGCE
jgi:hypothetical protein